MDITPGIYVTSSLMNLMISAVTKASRKLLRDFGELNHIKVSRKGVNDFFTSADLHSEKVIIEELAKARPAYSVLSEEHGFVEGEDKDHCWVVDPLDGTVNFMRGIPFWCISVALKSEGEIIAGVAYDALHNEAFFAEKGKGAFLNNRRLRLSPVHCLGDAVVAYGGVPPALVDRISKSCMAGRRLGSTALDLAYVAAGRIDAFIRSGENNEWDVAAGTLIAEEAGVVIRSSEQFAEDSSNTSLFAATGIDIVDEFWDLVAKG